MKAALILLAFTFCAVAEQDCSQISVIGQNYERTQSLPLISSGKMNIFDPAINQEFRSFVIEGELANNLIKDYSFDRISGGEIGFHSKMMISQGNSGQITMAYLGCAADVESVIQLHLDFGECGFFQLKWKMQCPSSFNYIRVLTSSGQDLTQTRRVDLPIDQNTVTFTVTAFDQEQDLTLHQMKVLQQKNLSIYVVDSDFKRRDVNLTQSFREAEVTMDISCEDSSRSSEEVGFPISGARGKDQFEFVITIVKFCEVIQQVVERYPVVVGDQQYLQDQNDQESIEEQEAVKLFEDIIEEEWDSLQPYIYFMRYVIYASAFFGVLWLVSVETDEGQKGNQRKSVKEVFQECFHKVNTEKKEPQFAQLDEEITISISRPLPQNYGTI